MTAKSKPNPAERASERCLNEVFAAMESNRSFLVEAGAGAGKTYTLVEALKRQIEINSKTFQRSYRRIACITYTNVAKDEIRSRTDNHPVILAETIHAFAWEAIKEFQLALRGFMSDLSDNWTKRIEQAGGVANQTVIYNLGYPKITVDEIYLHHDDVIKLFVHLLDNPKFRRILTSRFPIIFIDEYQDTNAALASALVKHFIESDGGPLIGFFGDHWQKIYGRDSIGAIQATPDKLVVIGKEANFRSDKLIVEALNRLRPQLPQHCKDENSSGEIMVFHSNDWSGERQKGGHWGGDLPNHVTRNYLKSLKQYLADEKGWIFDSSTTKILMLTNSALAEEQGFASLLGSLGPEELLKKQDERIVFFIDVLDPGVQAFSERRFGKMLEIFGMSNTLVVSQADKVRWYDSLTKLAGICASATIGEVIDHLVESRMPLLPRKIEERENKRRRLMQKPPNEIEESEQTFIDRENSFRAVPFAEVKKAADFINDSTPFSTKHGVKGAEFENVLVVLGRGWNLYNWNQMLEWAHNGVPAGKADSFERNMNLFYVASSRAKKRLVLLFTQQLTDTAIKKLREWFGDVYSFTSDFTERTTNISNEIIL